MIKIPFSKHLLKGVSVPLLAALAASAFFSATPGLLFAGPIDTQGAFATQVDVNGNPTNFGLDRTGNSANTIIFTLGGVDREYFRLAGNPANGNPRLPANIEAIVAKCFPVDNAPLQDFTASDVQAMVAFFNSF